MCHTVQYLRGGYVFAILQIIVIFAENFYLINMDQDLKRELSNDPDGLLTYEYIANHIGECDNIMDDLADNMVLVDSTGQFLVSAARYLYAIDPEKYSAPISKLIANAIEKDRERRYIGDLLQAIWGADFMEHAEELSAADDNFRRIYKRLYSTGI